MSWVGRRYSRRLLTLRRHLAVRRHLSSSSSSAAAAAAAGGGIADPVGDGERAKLVSRTREVLRQAVDLVPDFNGLHRRTLRTAQVC